jgi:hypothetical protein
MALPTVPILHVLTPNLPGQMPNGKHSVDALRRFPWNKREVLVHSAVTGPMNAS